MPSRAFAASNIISEDFGPGITARLGFNALAGVRCF